jgi:membrane protease subunit HflC
MNKPIVIAIGLVLLASLLLFSTTYTVKYHEVGVKTRFGQATGGVITEPGLGFKWPRPIESVITLDKRLKMVETPLETVQTADGQQLVVMAFMLWKIDESDRGPLTFYSSYPSAQQADQSLRDEFRTAVKRGVAAYRFSDLIGASSRITDAERAIREEMMDVRDKGVVPVTVGFRQMSLPAKTTSAVITRMNSERRLLADIERIKGSAEAQRIESEAQIDADKIRAFANQRAEEIRAQGDAEAAEYLQQMSVDEELAIFLVWIDALERSLSATTTFVLEPDVAPWHLINRNAPVSSKGIPMSKYVYDVIPGTFETGEQRAEAPGAGGEGESGNE